MSGSRLTDEAYGRPMSPAYDEAQQPYDPACVFDLEVMISMACKSPETIGETWPIIFDYISALLASAQSYSILLIERAVVGLLRLSLMICDQVGRGVFLWPDGKLKCLCPTAKPA